MSWTSSDDGSSWMKVIGVPGASQIGMLVVFVTTSWNEGIGEEGMTGIT